ncbi:MurR/RpiR family transcriptional regulator [Marinihelvus fidelis]|uniref:MurR/RpiR family transcriptional regulator n=1 Tax=Marinihelvus fidelis TaxID=2613842 RepID=A0A5N0T9B7_9GAMM|nr:MurR/RpiR family transcriptional regulator [Marinihelvus fidelis]KAA9131615.1 MurR/RpiR family transcriptional regulator [Marinihelvus fidelis]
MSEAPRDLETLRNQIVARHDELSPRLRQVAAYVLENPSEVGLQTLAVIAQRCGVQPSTIVRFAKAFGYDGASPMQMLFREELINSVPSPSYTKRVHQFQERAGTEGPWQPAQLLQEFARSNTMALEQLQDTIPESLLDQAVDALEACKSIYLVGLRRSFPVVAYMAYALRHVDKPTHLIDGLAGMILEQSSMITADDLLVAVSFKPYAPETSDIVARARERGATIVSISDSLLSPAAREADISFEVRDAEVMKFRSLTASFCLAQTLVISLAQRLDARDAT